MSIYFDDKSQKNHLYTAIILSATAADTYVYMCVLNTKFAVSNFLNEYNFYTSF